MHAPLSETTEASDETPVAEQRASFEDFFHAEHARLFRALCLVTGSRQEADEVATGTIVDLGVGFHPVWSPDSTKLVISNPEGSGGFAILELDASDRRTILRTSRWAAAWSPDGEWIAFNDAGLTASRG